uniref:Vesicle-trafficking protein SEC22b-like n=1 Tax=Hirondellea gigas TaxID=1518452 RepID=A0A2P2HXY7_9CRUS
MVLMTILARTSDGLPLAASVQDEQSGRGLLDYQNQAKMLFKKLTPNSPLKCSISTGSYIYHYLIDGEVCYLCLCDQGYSKKTAFTYLEDLAREFNVQYSRQVAAARRPYSFIEFDLYMSKARRQFSEGVGRRHMHQLRDDLNDVQRIMMDNIDDVLSRGTALQDLETKASGLSAVSQQYRKDAQYLNLRSTFAKVAAASFLVLIFLLYFFVF